MTLIQNLLKGKNQDRTPVWLMRQAGRYLPEYRETKKLAKDFLDMCYSPDLAAKITLQPIERFDFDAAIIFSDILVIPHALGLDLRFDPGKGPVIEKINFNKKVSLNPENIKIKLQPVYEAIKRVRKTLSKDKDLIGFAGAPWTLFAYMVEGGGSKNFENANIALINERKKSEEIIDVLTEAIAAHLINQIASGANIIQIFDSWAGEISEQEYEDFIIKPTSLIIKKIRKAHGNVPIIAFPRGSNFKYEKFSEKVGMDILSIDQEIPLWWAKERLQDKAVIQGNMDPMILLNEKKHNKGKVLKNRKCIWQRKLYL
jgi:uroporphyrinogen decarboxylase